MTAVDLQKRQKLFYSIIDQVEKDYHLYFGLKSIQKRLSQTERIYDHFILDHQSFKISFYPESDLPQEIRDLILDACHQTFSEQINVGQN